MSDNLAADYAKLLKNYLDLADGVRMIRRAVERASRAGVLPSIERIGMTPLQECEAISRAIYAAAAKHKSRAAAGALAGLGPDDVSR